MKCMINLGSLYLPHKTTDFLRVPRAKLELAKWNDMKNTEASRDHILKEG